MLKFEPRNLPMSNIVFRTPTTQREAFGLAECCRTNPGRLHVLLMAWGARGLDLNAPLEGKTLLYQALLGKHDWFVEGLLAAGADPTAATEGVPAFFTAAFYNETRALTAMLATGRIAPDCLNQAIPGGQTAAHMAAENQNPAMLMELLSRGANLFLPNEAGKTALDIVETWAGHAMEVHAKKAVQFLRTLRPEARATWLERTLPSSPRPVRSLPRF